MEASSLAVTPGVATTKPKKKSLPQDCIDPMWRFLPTSELIRFVSNKVSILPEQWALGLKYALELRLPLGIRESTESYERYPAYFAVVDCTDARVGIITQPEHFRHSAICHLVEEIIVPIRLRTKASEDQNAWRLMSALFGSLPNVRVMALDAKRNSNVGSNFKLPLASNEFCHTFQHLLPQLSAFRIVGHSNFPRVDCVNFAKALQKVECLQRFSGSPSLFSLVMQHAPNRIANLEQLNLQTDTMRNDVLPAATLLYIQALCRELTELAVQFHGETAAFFTAFRSLPFLTKLSLQVSDPTRAVVAETEQAVPTVTSFRLAYPTANIPEANFTLIVSKFPNIEMLTVVSCQQQVGSSKVNVLEQMQDLCTNQVLPRLHTLKLVTSEKWSLNYVSKSNLARFLENANLPAVVDLSEFGYVCMLSPDALLSIYLATKASVVRHLSIRGAVAARLLSCLMDHIVAKFGGNAAHLGGDFVVSWIDAEANAPSTQGDRLYGPGRAYAASDFLVRGRKPLDETGERPTFTLRVGNISNGKITSYNINEPKD